MAFPTIPDRETKRKQHFVMKKSTVVMGQVQSFTIDETINVSEENRISDTTKFQQREDKTSNVNVVIYVQDDVKELAMLLNGSELNPATGWDGATTVKLDPDSAAADYTVEVYDNLTAGAILQGVWTFDNWNPTTLNMPVGGSNTASITATVNGVAEDVYYTPAANIGTT